MARRTCFVISPVGDPGTPVRKRADQVFKYIIKPVTSELGYRVKRADRMKRAGIITSRILAAVADADLVVADLTGHDPGVFYELAIRHATRRPVVQLIDAAQEPPFDVANMRTIYVDIHDLDSARDARRELKRYVRAVRAGSAPIETPLRAAKSMRSLWHSEEPTDTFILEALDELRACKQDRLRREREARPAEATSQALRDFTLSHPTVDGSPISVPTANTAGQSSTGVAGQPSSGAAGQPSSGAAGQPSSGAAGQPSSVDAGAGLFASTHEAQRGAGPAPRVSSRKARKRP